MKPALYIQGMHGMGDCIHQRAVLRQLMQRHTITLETSWAALYHDLVGRDLTLTRRPVALRTQSKNQEREASKFAPGRHPAGPAIRISYGGAQVVKTDSKTILEAMCIATGTSYAEADFRLPVPDAWHAEMFKTLGSLPLIAAERPWLVYRPLVARPEWRGSIARNADPDCYAKLFQAIRDTFFVISVADLEPGREWVIGPELHPDMAFHRGELTFETLAALFNQADLVFTSSGFAAILAPAVGTPVISVTGGYESVACHTGGARFAPYLGIGPKVECSCWTSQCRQPCDKSIDMETAEARLREFLSEISIQIRDNTTPFAEMFTTAPTPPAATFGAQRQATLLRMQQGGLKA